MSSHSFPIKQVKIRKTCRCYGCGELHEKGDQMFSSKGIIPGEGFWSFHFCAPCNEYYNTKINWNDWDDGLGPYEIRECSDYPEFRKEFENRDLVK